MPAAAVIPAPIAYTNIAAVKKLVVEFLVTRSGRLLNCDLCHRLVAIFWFNQSGIRLSGWCYQSFTVKKLECSKQAYAVEYFSME